MKNLDDALFSAKWDVLRLIALGPKNPTELSKVLGTSLANVTSQLRLLEAYGLVTKHKDGNEEKRVGKPRLSYLIAHDASYVGVVSDGFAEKKSLTLKDPISLVLRSLLVLEQEEAFTLLRFLFSHEEVLHKCDGIGLIRTGKDTIELFLHSEVVDEIRKKYSNTIIADLKGKSKKIICWTHAGFEIDQGITRKDPYFVNMFKTITPLQDRKGVLVASRRRVERASPPEERRVP